MASLKIKNKAVLILTVVVCLIMFANPLYASDDENTHIGIIASISGLDITLKREGLIDSKPMLMTQVFEGDAIKTGLDSRVKILLIDDSIVTLAPKSTFKFRKFNFDLNNNLRNSFLELVTGKIRVLVTKIFSNDKSNFEVETPTAVCGIRGTEVAVEFNGNETDVTVFQGKVEVFKSHAEKTNGVFVSANSHVNVSKDKNLTEAKQVAAVKLLRLRKQIDGKDAPPAVAYLTVGNPKKDASTYGKKYNFKELASEDSNKNIDSETALYNDDTAQSDASFNSAANGSSNKSGNNYNNGAEPGNGLNNIGDMNTQESNSSNNGSSSENSSVPDNDGNTMSNYSNNSSSNNSSGSFNNGNNSSNNGSSSNNGEYNSQPADNSNSNGTSNESSNNANTTGNSNSNDDNPPIDPDPENSVNFTEMDNHEDENNSANNLQFEHIFIKLLLTLVR